MRIICEFEGSVGELTDALTAAEIAANTIPKAKIHFRLKDERLTPIARSAWFVKGVLGPDNEAS